MSPDLAFLLSLAFRMAVAAAFVVSASIITERAGPVIGALVATLPISAGPTYVLLAQRHRVLVSCGSAIIVWLLLAAIIRTVHWSLDAGLIANAVVFAVC